MTLHEAIEDLLLEYGRSMTTREIADQINERQSYRKKDGSPIAASQVHLRTRNYHKLFVQERSMISLVAWGKLDELQISGRNGMTVPTTVPTHQPNQPATFENHGHDQLLHADRFLPAADVDSLVPDVPGLYAIRVKDSSSLPAPFSALSSQRGHDLLYVGVASQSLKKRFLGQELRARGHGTFFRSVGAMLGFRPVQGSLIGRANTRNYRFSANDELEIIAWLNANTVVSWIEFPAEQQRFAEGILISQQLPLLNLAGNPAASAELSALRAECVRIANTPAQRLAQPCAGTSSWCFASSR